MKIMKKLFATSPSGLVFYYRVMMGLMTAGVVIAIIGGTQDSKPYDERNYILILGIFALIMFFKFVDWEKEARQARDKAKAEQAAEVIKGANNDKANS